MSHNLGKEILADKEFRHYWGEMYLRQNIPFQIKTMRTQRKLSQIEAGEILGKGQNGVSRLESPDYGRLTLQSLLGVARGYDVGLIVKFVPFSRLLREYEDVSFDALKVASPDAKEFPEEVAAINEWSAENPEDGIIEATDATFAEPFVSTIPLSLDFTRELPESYRQYLSWKQVQSETGLATSDKHASTTASNLALAV